MVIEITEPQEGWKYCSRCKRDGFRPPWQGYCYDCQREYQRERNRKKANARTEFENQQAIKSWNETQRLIAASEGRDPNTVEDTLPPWLDPNTKFMPEYHPERLGPPDDGPSPGL